MLDFSAEKMRHELHAVADAEHGDAEFEDGAVGMRRVLGIHGHGAAAEDDSAGFESGDFLRGGVIRDDL